MSFAKPTAIQNERKLSQPKAKINMNGVKFRDSLKGYNKDDVNSYITALNKEFKDTEIKLEEKIEALEKKLSGLEASQKASPENAEKLAAAELRIKELEEQAGELKTENEKLRSDLSADEENRRKAELYDKMSCQVGDVLLHAGDAADAMLKNAESEAKRINTEAEDFKRSTSEKLKSMIDEANTVFKAMSQEALGAVSKYNTEVRKTLDDISENLRVKSEDMQTSLEKGNRELYEKMLCDIDRIYGEAARGLSITSETTGKENR